MLVKHRTLRTQRTPTAHQILSHHLFTGTFTGTFIIRRKGLRLGLYGRVGEAHAPAVALKIIKLGKDTRSVFARFDAERQAPPNGTGQTYLFVARRFGLGRNQGFGEGPQPPLLPCLSLYDTRVRREPER